MRSNKFSKPTPNDSTSRHHGHQSAKIRKQWSARILRQGSLTGPAFIELAFPTEGGGISTLRLSYSDLRPQHLNRLLDEFSKYLPIFPADVDGRDTAQARFIQALVAAASKSIELLPEQTGFVDAQTFVTHSEILRSDGTRTPVPRQSGPETHAFNDTNGTLEGTTDLVLKLANEFDLPGLWYRRGARRVSAELREPSPAWR